MLANHQHLTPNTQHPTSAVTFCEFCMPEAFCEIEIVRKGSVKSVSSVRGKTPQQVTCVSSHRVGAFYFSQKNTDEQNTQRATETLSQPISQSVKANVSWKASVNSVCRRPSVGSKCAQKGSVNSVSSVRDKTPQQVTCVSSHRVGAFYFSQKNTDEQNTQHSKQVVVPPPSPPPKGRGVITEIPL